MRKINCFGKINLLLRVGSLRGDGFHEILTIYQSVNLHDTVAIGLTEKTGIELSSSDPSIPTDASNLAWKAAEKVIRSTGYDGGVFIQIEKRIPAGGGLGGGSSDAAGTLRLLNRLLNHPLSESQLLAHAAELGSDVPFFLVGGTALGTGRGEVVEALPDCAPFSFVAVFPEFSFPTGEMYHLLDRAKACSLVKRHENPEVLLQSRENSFDQVVSAMSEDVAGVMQKIREDGFEVMLAGSGSTFLVLDGPGPLSAVCLRLPQEWQWMELKSISRREALGDDVF